MKNKANKSNIDRIPIVTILGHVDHGKTTILDKIRHSSVQEKEAGGITQKISVFTIDVHGSNISKLSFVDTPGHEAFDLMRQRGGDIADIVLLVIAADDGIKPQTEESIEIIKKSKAKPIVVFNKVDLPNINLEKIKRDLSSKGIQVEGYGGNVPVVEVSAKTGLGIDTLIETIGLLIEVEGIEPAEDLKEGLIGKAYILESVKDKSRGYVSTMIVTSGKMSAGDWLVYNDGSLEIEKIKGFVTESGEQLSELNAGEGARIIGVSKMLDLGTKVFGAVEKDKTLFKTLFEEEVIKENIGLTSEGADWFSSFFSEKEEDHEDEGAKTLNIMIKSSSEGSLQAIQNSITKLNIDGYTAKIISSGIGEVTLTDVESAEVTKSIILAFEVNADNFVKKEATNRKVLLREYDIVYKLIEEVSDVLTSMSTPKESEEELGDAEVREIFVLSNGNKVIGGRVKNGLIKRGERCYIVRNDEILCTGKIISLKHAKNDVVEAQKGADFGAIIEPTPKEVEVGDQLYCFKVVN